MESARCPASWGRAAGHVVKWFGTDLLFSGWPTQITTNAHFEPDRHSDVFAEPPFGPSSVVFKLSVELATLLPFASSLTE